MHSSTHLPIHTLSHSHFHLPKRAVDPSLPSLAGLSHRPSRNGGIVNSLRVCVYRFHRVLDHQQPRGTGEISRLCRCVYVTVSRNWLIFDGQSGFQLIASHAGPLPSTVALSLYG